MTKFWRGPVHYRIVELGPEEAKQWGATHDIEATADPGELPPLLPAGAYLHLGEPGSWEVVRPQLWHEEEDTTKPTISYLVNRA